MFDARLYLDDFLRSVRHLDVESVSRMSAMIFEAWVRGRTVFCCGNGGSAASATHFATDLTKLTISPRHSRRVKAVALTESLSAITAIGNDLSYGEIFVEQLRPFMQAGDVLLGFSTSGSSPNVLRAVQYANDCGAVSLGITGRNGAAMQALALETLMIDSTSVQHIEDATMVASHIICMQVKERVAEWPRTAASPVPAADGLHGALTM